MTRRSTPTESESTRTAEQLNQRLYQKTFPVRGMWDAAKMRSLRGVDTAEVETIGRTLPSASGVDAPQ